MCRPLAEQRTLIEVALADPDATAAGLRSACEGALASGSQLERLITALLLATSERGVEQWEQILLAAVASAILQFRGSNTGPHHSTISLSVCPGSN